MENNLTELQKQVVEILEKEGFTNIHFQTWAKSGRMDYDVKKIKTIADLMATMYKAGAKEKVWEIKRILEV